MKLDWVNKMKYQIEVCGCGEYDGVFIVDSLNAAVRKVIGNIETGFSRDVADIIESRSQQDQTARFDDRFNANQLVYVKGVAV